MKPSIRIVAGALLILSPVAVYGCSQVASMRSQASGNDIVVLRDDPGAPTSASGLDQNSVVFGDLNVGLVPEDPRCSVAVDQIDDGPASGCATYKVAPIGTQVGELEGEQPDGVAIEEFERTGLSAEARFSSLTGDGIDPGSFSPSRELQMIGRGGALRSTEAMGVAAEVLAQSGVLVDPSATPEGATPDGVTPQVPGGVVTTP